MSENQDIGRSARPRSDGRDAPRVRTLLACDLVDSTALVERLGDSAAAELLRRLDRATRDLIYQHGGREIDKTDGYLLLFERPIEAVNFALHYQRSLRSFDPERAAALQARVGIHVGEVVLWENPAADVAAGAKPVDIEGLAKPVVARLMGLAMPGQILLSGVAFALAQRADRELAEPGRVRWLTHGRYRFKGLPAPMLVHEVGESGTAPLQAPPSSTKASREVPLWRRPSMLALEAAALLAAAAVPFVLSLRSTPAIAFGERDWVVMGDVRNLTSESQLSDALDSALRVGLEQSRYVNVLPNLQVQDALRRMERPGARIDRDVGVQLAAREGARALLLPSLTEIGRDLRFSVEIVDPGSGNTVRVESADAGSVDAVLPAIDRTLSALRASLGESIKDIEEASAPLARITTANLDALRAYSQVDQAMSEGKIDDAVALLQHAVDIDPEFAMALARLGELQISYLRQVETGLANHDRAAALAERLSRREQMMILARQASLTSAPDELERVAVFARLYPDTAAARHNLGLLLAFARREPAEAVPHFEYVARSSHPRRGESLVALAHSHLILGDLAKAADALREAHIVGGRAPLGQEWLLDLVEGRHEAVLTGLQPPSSSDTARGAHEKLQLRVAIALDRGHFDEALRLIEAGSHRDPGGAWNQDRAILALARLAIDAHHGRWNGAQFEDFVARERHRLGTESERSGRTPELLLAYAALLALRHGEERGAAAVLDAIAPTATRTVRRAPGALLETARCLQRPLQARLTCLDALPEPRWFATEVATWDTARALDDAERSGALAARLGGLQARASALAEYQDLELLAGNVLDLARITAAGKPAADSTDAP